MPSLTWIGEEKHDAYLGNGEKIPDGNKSIFLDEMIVVSSKRMLNSNFLMIYYLHRRPFPWPRNTRPQPQGWG